MKNTKNIKKGMSLIETMMTLIIFSFIIIVSARVLMVTQNANALIMSQVKLNDLSRITEEKISQELSKVLYFVPGKNSIIPNKVKNDSFAFKADDDNFVTLPPDKDNSSNLANGVCFLSHRKYYTVSDILSLKIPLQDQPLEGSIGGKGGINVSDFNSAVSNPSVYNAKVQLIDYNCFYLTTKNLTSDKKGKDPKNKGSLQLAFFKQKGFFNSNQSSIQWPPKAETDMEADDQSTITTNTNLLIKALKYKDFTPVQVPEILAEYKPSDVGFTLDTDLNFPAVSADYNSSISIFSDNLGAVPPYSGTSPTYHRQDKYSSDLDFSDSSNNPNKFNPIDLGFRIKTRYLSKLDTTSILSLSAEIDLNFSYHNELLKKNVYTFRSFTVRPNIISY